MKLNTSLQKHCLLTDPVVQWQKGPKRRVSAGRRLKKWSWPDLLPGWTPNHCFQKLPGSTASICHQWEVNLREAESPSRWQGLKVWRTACFRIHQGPHPWSIQSEDLDVGSGICILRSFPYFYPLTPLHWLRDSSCSVFPASPPAREKRVKSYCLANIMGECTDHHSLHPSGSNGVGGTGYQETLEEDRSQLQRP